MAGAFLDTNIIIRYLTGDDLEKQAAAAAVFAQIEKGAITVFVPDVIVAEAVFVLSSPRLYHRTRQEIAELLTPLLQLPRLEVQNRQIHLRALQVYAETKDLDFEDAYLVAAMEQTKSNRLISYDTDFDSFPFIIREEPEPAKKVA